MRALFTPGHTPEHTSYVVTDRARTEDPWFVLTGDCLFVGDVGRPDLLVGDMTLDVMDETMRAQTQYESVKRLFALPDYVEVFPAHYGGSTCGGVNMSGKVSSTIAFEKHFNLAMRQPDAEAFARFVKETAKPFPDNYTRIKSLQPRADLEGRARGRPQGRRVDGSPRVTPQEVAAATAQGAVVIDMRPPKPFATEHIAGAINFQFNRADLADRADLALPRDVPFIVHAEPDPIAKVAVEILSDAGFTVRGTSWGD